MTSKQENFDITIKEISKLPFAGLQNSELVLQFTGKSINTSILNTLRRLSFNNVPTYAFTKETIIIDKNTSKAFNNDYMKNRISQITVMNIPNIPSYIDDEYWLDVNYADNTRVKHSGDTYVIDMYINAKNTTNEIIDITTYDTSVKLFINDKEANNFSVIDPCLIIQLVPGQEFICKARAVLGVGMRNNIWCGAGNTYYDNGDDEGEDDGINDNKKVYTFTMESQGQMDEYEILYKCCEVIRQKLKLIERHIDSNIDVDLDKKMITVNIDNETHTMSIINEYLQNRKDVTYSGFKRPDLLENKVQIKYVTSNKNVVEPFVETLHYVDSLFLYIQKQIVKIGRKYVSVI